MNARKLRWNNYGIASTIDFIVAFAIFMIIFSLFNNSLNALFQPFERKDLDLQTQAWTISSNLMESPGLLNNGTTDWEKYAPATLETELLRLGLACSSNQSHVLSNAKLMALQTNISLELARKALDLKRYFFQVMIEHTQTGQKIFEYGYDISNTKVLVTIQRLVVIEDNNQPIQAILNLKIFY